MHYEIKKAWFLFEKEKTSLPMHTKNWNVHTEVLKYHDRNRLVILFLFFNSIKFLWLNSFAKEKVVDVRSRKETFDISFVFEH